MVIFVTEKQYIVIIPKEISVLALMHDGQNVTHLVDKSDKKSGQRKGRLAHKDSLNFFYFSILRKTPRNIILTSHLFMQRKIY